MFDVEIVGAEAAIRELERLRATASPAGMRKTIRLATGLLHRTASAIVPVDTGRLKNSLFQDVIGRGNNIVGLVGTNVEYSIFVEQRVHFMQRTVEREASAVRSLFVEALRG